MAHALLWIQQQLGRSIIVRNKTYFANGALIELENLNGERFVITWGQEAAERFKKNFMSARHCTPETYQRLPAEKLLAGLERQQKGALANLIIWRLAN
jgi:hypothetical protein